MKQPTFTAVIAAYQIEKYADDLFRSIEKQTLPADELEVVIVDDGSRDGTLRKAQAWASRSKLQVIVKTQTNSGVAAARNLGIDLARGSWIAFVDSDDVLDRNYFESLANFIRRDVNSAASMLTSRSLIFNEKKGTAQDNHPLAWKYRRGDRLVSLEREPHVIHLAGHATIVRTNVVRENNIRFSSLVKPAFEDAHFIGVYLAQFSEPVIGLVASARYYYRKRADGSSLIDTTWIKAEKYTNEPKYGHLGLLEYLHAKKGHVPLWAQNTVLYSLYWYFRADRMIDSPLKSVPSDLLDQLWDSLYRIFEYIDADAIRNFNLVNYGWALKEGILRHFKNSSIIQSKNTIGYMWNADDVRRATRKIGYTFVGSAPIERIFLNGEYSTDAVTKSIRHEAFGRTLMYERVLILPRVYKVEVFLDGRKIEIKKPVGDSKKKTTFLSAPKRLQLASGKYIPAASEMVRRANRSSGLKRIKHGCLALYLKISEESWITGQNRLRVSFRLIERVASRYMSRLKARKMKSRDQETVVVAKSDAMAAKYKNSWIIMDHPARADDNGEHFYRYLQNNHPEIPILFMLKRDSADWNRLAADGFNLVGYGSTEAVYSTLNAKYIISSHIDSGIYDPVSRHRFGPSPARRIFLQHGLVMNDLSRWLNTKGLALMISSSPQEFASFVGDGSTYKFTEKEVVLTGLPRHDSLIGLRNTHTIERNFMSFAPTWRQGLVKEIANAPDLDTKKSILTKSQFYIGWNSVLQDLRVRETANANNLQMLFVLHDHLSKYKNLFDFGAHVKVVSFSELKVQEFILSSQVLITDYSSIATEAAIGGSSVAYYQFDADAIFNNGHTFTRGWFDYAENGFGPVLDSPEDVSSWVSERSLAGWGLAEQYEERLNLTLPVLDGTASQRVLSAIMNTGNPLFPEWSNQIARKSQ
ncbi:bifunctional glycosyltransferase/CDP-glycerol:glycerophosphate glycerophosphotransferase [Glutamicibacter arilaitensis]|uniref:bifunctional glycosyltransferase/CDP-glycerol:glycerophosphate glycerophosphotransferase n=1 Tax=Glutamicibacter arilaitensis TaxID=256701 RepID=UPI003FD4FECE